MAHAAELDLAAVLDHFGIDYQPGKTSQKILCPVHEEHVPSCSINLDEGWYRCHACNSKGDGYNLIMEKERASFADALKIAETLGAPQARSRAGRGREDGLLGRTRPGRRSDFRGVRVRLLRD